MSNPLPVTPCFMYVVYESLPGSTYMDKPLVTHALARAGEWNPLWPARIDPDAGLVYEGNRVLVVTEDDELVIVEVDKPKSKVWKERGAW